MDCLKIDTGVFGRCRDGKPGLTEIRMANIDDISTITLNAEENLITNIAMSSGTTFYKFSLNRENASFTDNANINIPNGTVVYRPSIMFKLTSLDVDVRDTFLNLSQATVVVLAKSLAGTWYMLGKNNGLDMTDGSSLQSGLAATDFAGAEITLEGLEPTPLIEIDSTFDVDTITA